MSLIVTEDMEIEFDSPPGYKFRHPCGNIERNESKFFYNPKLPVDSVTVRDAERCTLCSCFFVSEKTRIGMCQGLEIKIAIDEKISYPILKRV